MVLCYGSSAFLYFCDGAVRGGATAGRVGPVFAARAVKVLAGVGAKAGEKESYFNRCRAPGVLLWKSSLMALGWFSGILDGKAFRKQFNLTKTSTAERMFLRAVFFVLQWFGGKPARRGVLRNFV